MSTATARKEQSQVLSLVPIHSLNRETPVSTRPQIARRPANQNRDLKVRFVRRSSVQISPEEAAIRAERVQALKSLISQGLYNPRSEEIVRAMLG